MFRANDLKRIATMYLPRKRMFSVFVFVSAAVFAVPPTFVRAQDNPYAPQPQSSLPQMLSISWQTGPDLRQGVQDSDGGIVDNTLITVGGFCAGQTDVPGKENKYPRGFLQKAWGLNLQSPQSGWQSLPDFPGVAQAGTFLHGRQQPTLLLWRLQLYQSVLLQRRVSALEPKRNVDVEPASEPAVAHQQQWDLHHRIEDLRRGRPGYDGSQLYTNSDRAGDVSRLGSRLLALDTNNLAAGWQVCAACPGTSRFVEATAAVGGKLYVFGGTAGNDNPTENYATVVDNWVYDPASDVWTRLHDLPVASGNFPGGSIVYDNRYVLLGGGCQYSDVLAPDGSIQPVYGTTTKHDPGYDYDSDLWVYDTQTNTFGTATPLPLNNNLPMTVVNGNQIYMIGGENRRCEAVFGDLGRRRAFRPQPRPLPDRYDLGGARTQRLVLAGTGLLLLGLFQLRRHG